MLEYCPLWTIANRTTEKQLCFKECGMWNMCHRLPTGTLEEKDVPN